MGELEPGVRRLCVATDTAAQGLLASACHAGEIARFCFTVDSDGTEMAFAPPGVDEVAMVSRVVTELHRLAIGELTRQRTVLAAFHVGITRIEGGVFGGQAALRTRGLLFDPAVRAIACGRDWPIAVVMSEGLYTDLRSEGVPDRDWQRVPAANAWLWWGEAAWEWQTSRLRI